MNTIPIEVSAVLFRAHPPPSDDDGGLFFTAHFLSAVGVRERGSGGARRRGDGIPPVPVVLLLWRGVREGRGEGGEG